MRYGLTGQALNTTKKMMNQSLISLTFLDLFSKKKTILKLQKWHNNTINTLFGGFFSMLSKYISSHGEKNIWNGWNLIGSKVFKKKPPEFEKKR